MEFEVCMIDERFHWKSLMYSWATVKRGHLKMYRVIAGSRSETKRHRMNAGSRKETKWFLHSGLQNPISHVVPSSIMWFHIREELYQRPLFPFCNKDNWHEHIILREKKKLNITNMYEWGVRMYGNRSTIWAKRIWRDIGNEFLWMLNLSIV